MNDSLVTLFPLNAPGGASTTAADMGKGISSWTCGGTGTTQAVSADGLRQARSSRAPTP